VPRRHPGEDVLHVLGQIARLLVAIVGRLGEGARDEVVDVRR
jgi:hypothetical protein